MKHHRRWSSAGVRALAVGAALVLFGCPDTGDGAADVTDSSVGSPDGIGGADTGGTSPDSTAPDASGTGDAADAQGTEPQDAAAVEDAIPGCHCASAAECGPGQLCLDPGPNGDCVPVPGPTGCWTDADCGAQAKCQNASVCPCDAPCAQASTPGTCVPDFLVDCCSASDDCPLGYVCSDAAPTGVCKPAPPPGSCWASSDCDPGFVCNAQVCGCDSDCGVPDQIGECVSGVLGCCAEDADCGPGLTCSPIGAGSCQPAPAPGACWKDADCGEGLLCEGAFACPCNADCAEPDQAGTCVAPLYGCCQDDGGCEGDLVCATFGAGSCLQSPAPGKCWKDGDCAPSEKCTGASACPCNADCADEDVQGTCEPKLEDGCCFSVDDCEGGMLCVGQGSDPGQCVESAAPGQCWSDADCGDGETCAGAVAVSCLVNTPSVPGHCEKQTACQTIDPASFGVCAKVIGVVFDGAKCVTASGCGCNDLCDYVFETVDACQQACASADKCAGFEQPGCVEKGCPDGQKCDTNVGCVPSGCGCDPETGDIMCTADCGGGTCVPNP